MPQLPTPEVASLAPAQLNVLVEILPDINSEYYEFILFQGETVIDTRNRYNPADVDAETGHLKCAFEDLIILTDYIIQITAYGTGYDPSLPLAVPFTTTTWQIGTIENIKFFQPEQSTVLDLRFDIVNSETHFVSHVDVDITPNPANGWGTLEYNKMAFGLESPTTLLGIEMSEDPTFQYYDTWAVRLRPSYTAVGQTQYGEWTDAIPVTIAPYWGTTLFLVSGYWGSPSDGIWSYEEGGGVSGYPDKTKDVIIDIPENVTIYIYEQAPYNLECKSLTIKGLGTIISLLDVQIVDVWGNLDIQINTLNDFTRVYFNMIGDTNQYLYNAIKANVIIKSTSNVYIANETHCELLLINSGTIYFQSNVTISGYIYYYQEANPLEIYMNTYTLTTPSFAVMDSVDTIIHADESTIKIYGESASYGTGFDGGGLSYNKVEIAMNSSITNSNTFNELKLTKGITVEFLYDTTQTVNSLVSDADSSNHVTIKPYPDYLYFNINKPSGEVNVNYWNIQHCIAGGGATFNAYYSIDMGENSGWNFIHANHNSMFVFNEDTWKRIRKTRYYDDEFKVAKTIKNYTTLWNRIS